MFKKMCVFYVDNKVVSRHIVQEVKHGEKGFYRDTTSMNAFSERENQRFYNAQLKNKILKNRVFVCNYKEWIKDNEKYQEEKIPVIEHENIKDFYISIGYNIAKKRYI